jgi:hypothetical protein
MHGLQPFRRQNRRVDRSRAAGASPVFYGTIEHRNLLLNVFSTPEGWKVAVTKAAYPFREIHAAMDGTMDAAIERAKHWVDRPELRDPHDRTA